MYFMGLEKWLNGKEHLLHNHEFVPHPVPRSQVGCSVYACDYRSEGVETGGWHLAGIQPSLEDVIPQVQRNFPQKNR